jgi:hypothetical protein
VNNPPVGLVTPDTDPDAGARKTYDPHLDPQLQWAGKAELASFEVPNEGWARLAKNLKAEIDEELIEAYRGTVSLPFELEDHSRVAVKIQDDRGVESLKVVEVK